MREIQGWIYSGKTAPAALGVSLAGSTTGPAIEKMRTPTMGACLPIFNRNDLAAILRSEFFTTSYSSIAAEGTASTTSNPLT